MMKNTAVYKYELALEYKKEGDFSKALNTSREVVGYVRRSMALLEEEHLENTDLYKFFIDFKPKCDKLYRELK